MTNILLLSVGTRNKVIQYFKKEFAGVGNVVVTDLTEIAPAIYEADKHYQVPRIIEDGYIDLILNICKKEQISGVLSLIDPELSLIAKNKERFAEIGVTIIGSSYDLCEMALDKMQMFTWLKEHGYNCAKSYVDKEAFYKDLDAGEISFPVFVKPVRGSASIAINKVKDKETMDLLWAHDDNLMIQEFLNGQEIGGYDFQRTRFSVHQKENLDESRRDGQSCVIQRRKTVCADREVCKGMRMERSD